jgi:hypothetical protein
LLAGSNSCTISELESIEGGVTGLIGAFVDTFADTFVVIFIDVMGACNDIISSASFLALADGDLTFVGSFLIENVFNGEGAVASLRFNLFLFLFLLLFAVFAVFAVLAFLTEFNLILFKLIFY